MPELTKTVHVKVTERQFADLSQAAWSRRLSNSEWIRQCVFGIGDKHEPVDLKVGKVVLGPATEPVLPKSYHTGTCSKCGAKGVKTTINREMKEVCYKCAGV